MYKVLTVAGSDSGGGAGIQTDLKTFAALGVYGTSVITALTAQNTLGVHGIHAVPPDFIACQLEAVLSDISADAAKTGMLGDANVISIVAKYLTKYRIRNLVVDPVMIAQSGQRLLPEDAVDTLRNQLLPLAMVATPNLPEAEILLGKEISSVTEMVAAAREIRRLGPRHVLLKGGHLPGTEMVDIFFDGKDVHTLSESKIDTINTHGTGCTYAAAITAYLAKGMTPLAAFIKAKKFITDAITHGICVGSGYGPTNPIGAIFKELELGNISRELARAVLLLQKAKPVANLIAAGQTNLFYCQEGAGSLAEIISYPAPLLLCHQQIKAVGEPTFDCRLFPAESLLAAHKKNSRIRAMINLRHTPEIASAIKTIGYQTITQNTSTSILAAAPEALILEDTPDKEPQLILFAETVEEVAEKTAALARSFCGC
ncbi:MAG: bifunctional hydroxymethylpyrimidine kinase/phosphomethylpyrimidine kinase [Clostridium sp.]|nr:bifunctional hydroxymethylpyrimidine kinase/phosphomethylpyrimidine kinase [Clostridium sp.]